MMPPRLTPLVASLPATVPFVGPEAQERARGRGFRARLGANESVFGPSPKAIAAMQAAAADSWKYGDPENHDLVAALATAHAVTPANIMVGEGIDGLLGYIVRLMVSPGDAVVFDFRIIHGAPPNTSATSQRRAFSLRLVGDNARFLRRDGIVTSPPFPDVKLKHRDPLDGPDFPILFERQAG